MKPVVFVFTLLLLHFALGCTETSLKTDTDGDFSGTPCTSDLDCKGDRICVDGICKAPDAEGDGDWDVDLDQSADGDRESEDELDQTEADGDTDQELETDAADHEGEDPDGDLDDEMPENEVEGDSESDTELDCELEEPTCTEGFTCACNVLYECVDGYWEETQDCKWDTCIADEGICRVERALKFGAVVPETRLEIEDGSASVCEREYWTVEMWVKVDLLTGGDIRLGTVYQDSLGLVYIDASVHPGPVIDGHPYARMFLSLVERHDGMSGTSVGSISSDVEPGWAHIALVRDYVDRRMYVNGALVAEKDITHKIVEREYEVTYIGYACTLVLDEVRISDVARYTENFEPQTRYEPDEDTLSLWHMNEGFDDVTYDEVSGAEGDLMGNVSWTAGVGPWSE